MPEHVYQGPERRSAIEYEFCPRYHRHELSEDQITDIAKKAVLMARDEFYQEVGRTVAEKFLVVLGMAAVAAAIWLAKHDVLK